MRHVYRTIEQLRRYIAGCDDRDALQEVDALLGVALEEVKRKLKQAGWTVHPHAVFLPSEARPYGPSSLSEAAGFFKRRVIA